MKDIKITIHIAIVHTAFDYASTFQCTDFVKQHFSGACRDKISLYDFGYNNTNQNRIYLKIRWDSGITILGTSNLGTHLRLTWEKKFCESTHRYFM